MTDRHADFEALSAYIDGEAPEWADHVEACAQCRATAAELRALAVAVAAPVAARSTADVERDIAAALDAVPTSAASAPAPAIERPAARRRSGNPWALGAVAAIVLAVLGLSGVVLSGSRQSDDTTTVAGPALRSEANLDARTGSEAGGGVAGAAPALPPSDLGDVGDAATLRSRAQPGVATGSGSGGSAVVGGAAIGGSGGAGGSVTESPTTAGRSSSSANSGAASSSASSTVSPNAATGSSGAAVNELTPTTTLNQRAGATVVGTRPCEEQARTRDPNLGPVTYFATARQGAVAGFVLGFGPAPGSAPAPVTLLLLAQDGCAELLRSVGP